MEKEIIEDGSFEGERALFNIHDKKIISSRFHDGESPLKFAQNVELDNCTFEWKYPLWHSNNIKVTNSSFFTMSRSGIWYTKNIEIKDCIIDAPKLFRRCDGVNVINSNFSDASETLWNSKNIRLEHVKAKGDYLGFNAENVYVNDFYLDGNYCFDGGKNIVVKNATLNSKDSFWNCDNVVVENSTIIGEYIGWNSKNLVFINCKIESNQGFCYIDGLKLVNCELNNTDLCFESCSNVQAEVTSVIDSVKNPISGYIHALGIKELILDPKYVDKSKIEIKVDN